MSIPLGSTDHYDQKHSYLCSDTNTYFFIGRAKMSENKNVDKNNKRCEA
jgi:hypothetical protein